MQGTHTDILYPIVVPHFGVDLCTWMTTLDLTEQGLEWRFSVGAIATLPWPACNPDLNPIEQLWDILRCKIHQSNPPIQTKDALHQE